jgi:phosphate transport system protein
MNESQHLSSQFDEELGRLRTHVLQMGGMVETQVSSAIEAYSSGEVASVKSIVEADRKINDLEKAIDDDCAHVIAKRQPTASDLRLVLGISKIVTDLERAGARPQVAVSGALVHEDNRYRVNQDLAQVAIVDAALGDDAGGIGAALLGALPEP